MRKGIKNRKKSLILHMKMRTITCFGDRTTGTFLLIASVSRTKSKRIKKRKKSLTLHGWKVENKKNRGIWKWEQLFALLIGQGRFPYNCLGLSDEDNSVSRTAITLWMGMFSTALHLLAYSFTVAFCTIS